MSIKTEIDRLSAAKGELKAAIAKKGVDVPANSTIDDYAGYVRQIRTDNSEVPISQDWKSCSLEEFRAHDGAGIVEIYFEGEIDMVAFFPPYEDYPFNGTLTSYHLSDDFSFTCSGTKNFQIVDQNGDIIFATQGDGFIADQTGTWSISTSIYIGY